MGNELEDEANAVNKMGDKQYKAKNYTEAIKLYVESVKLMKMAGNEKKAENFQKELDEAVRKRAEEINNQGDKLYKDKKYKEAIDVYQSAWDLLQKAGEKWVNKRGKEFQKELTNAKIGYVEKVLQPQAEKHVDEKDWDGAIEVYQEISGIITPEIDEREAKKLDKDMKSVYERWADEVNSHGDKLYKEKNFKEAIPIYAESVRLIEKSDDQKKAKNFKKELSKAFKEQAQEINNIGDDLMKQKEYLKASELYAQSVNIAQESGDEGLVKKFTAEMEKSFEKFAQQINDKGDALYKEKKFEEAAKIYANSVEVAKESNKKRLIDNFQDEFEKAMEKWAAEVNSEGDKAMKAKQWDTAKEWYTKSVEIISRTGNKGKIKNYTKEMQKAYLQLAKEINNQGDDKYKAGAYQEAYELYDKSVSLAEASGDEGLVRNYSKERNKALKKME